MYDGNYPQYQFYQGPRPDRQFDPKMLDNALLQLLFQSQTQNQLLDAFTPGGAGGSGAPAQGGGSYLEQLLAQSQQAPAAQQTPAAQAPASPVAQVLAEAKKRQMMMDGGGMVDRSGYGGLGMSGY